MFVLGVGPRRMTPRHRAESRTFRYEDRVKKRSWLPKNLTYLIPAYLYAYTQLCATCTLLVLPYCSAPGLRGGIHPGSFFVYLSLTSELALSHARTAISTRLRVRPDAEKRGGGKAGERMYLSTRYCPVRFMCRFVLRGSHRAATAPEREKNKTEGLRRKIL